MSQRVLSHPRYSSWYAYLKRNLSMKRRDQINGVIRAYNQFGLEDRNCVLCGEHDYSFISACDRFGFGLNKRICNHCGLVQTNPRLKAEFHSVFYRDMYRPLYKGGKSRVNYEKMTVKQRRRGTQIMEFLQAQLPGTDFTKYALIEIGASNGGVLDAMRPHFREVWGCDLDEEAIAWGRDNLDLDLEVAAMPAKLKPKGPRLVMFSHVLEHVYDPLETLRQVRSLVTGDDLLYIGVPGINLVHEGAYGHDLSVYFHIGHVTDFSEGTFRILAARAGFETLYADETVEALLRKSEADELPWARTPSDSVDNIRAIEATRPRRWNVW